MHDQSQLEHLIAHGANPWLAAYQNAKALQPEVLHVKYTALSVSISRSSHWHLCFRNHFRACLTCDQQSRERIYAC